MFTFLHFIGAILISYLIITAITASVISDNYKWYKPTYKAITNREYVYNEKMSCEEITYFRKPGDNDIFSDDEILLFKEGSIKLLGRNKYIHKSFMNILESYTWYWGRKLASAINKEKNSAVNLENI